MSNIINTVISTPQLQQT